MAVIGGVRDDEARDKCDTESVSVFDMTTLAWKDRFDPDEVAYELPKNITDVIGGNKLGSAALIKPESWSGGIDDIFFGSDMPQVTAPAPGPGDDTPKKNSTLIGAIVGGIVGGLLALAAIAFGLLRLRRCLHRYSTDHDHEPQMNPVKNAQVSDADRYSTGSEPRMNPYQNAQEPDAAIAVHGMPQPTRQAPAQYR
ncbi:hypothetical protein DFP73DRAFT_601220 [Morchella snyderi]|nr:hypothetical protein DFP73DRAFT_601220 [Morchella snyderi]